MLKSSKFSLGLLALTVICATNCPNVQVSESWLYYLCMYNYAHKHKSTNITVYLYVWVPLLFLVLVVSLSSIHSPFSSLLTIARPSLTTRPFVCAVGFYRLDTLRRFYDLFLSFLFCRWYRCCRRSFFCFTCFTCYGIIVVALNFVVLCCCCGCYFYYNLFSICLLVLIQYPFRVCCCRLLWSLK